MINTNVISLLFNIETTKVITIRNYNFKLIYIINNTCIFNVICKIIEFLIKKKKKNTISKFDLNILFNVKIFFFFKKKA